MPKGVVQNLCELRPGMAAGLGVDEHYEGRLWQFRGQKLLGVHQVWHGYPAGRANFAQRIVRALQTGTRYVASSFNAHNDHGFVQQAIPSPYVCTVSVLQGACQEACRPYYGSLGWQVLTQLVGAIKTLQRCAAYL